MYDTLIQFFCQKNMYIKIYFKNEVIKSEKEMKNFIYIKIKR